MTTDTVRGGAIRREVFLAPPRSGVAVLASTFYTRSKGLSLLSMHELMSRSDTVDVAYFRYSEDNGRSWTAGEEVRTLEQRPQGKLRRALRGCVVDPVSGRFLRFRLEAILPSDDPLEGMWRWVVYYSVSEDGGFTWYLDEEAIQDGAEFSASHPVPGVWTGKNCLMVGDLASRPFYLSDGTLLVPVIVTPIGPEGRYYNPGGGYTYHDAAALRGRWSADGRHMSWELSQLAKGDPARSTRGMDEPTFAELADGRVLMLMRGSNDKKPQLPGWRWVSYSSDAGRTWTDPAPWTYAGGESFFSPAASSQLLTHSSGRIFWLGNISPANTTGNRPRYPFVVGEVNRQTGLLVKESVRTVDTRQAGEGELLALASPSAREDRETGEIVLNLTRWFEKTVGPTHDWTSAAYLYRIPVA